MWSDTIFYVDCGRGEYIANHTPYMFWWWHLTNICLVLNHTLVCLLPSLAFASVFHHFHFRYFTYHMSLPSKSFSILYWHIIVGFRCNVNKFNRIPCDIFLLIMFHKFFTFNENKYKSRNKLILIHLNNCKNLLTFCLFELSI